jgi:hypothetical protein
MSKSPIRTATYIHYTEPRLSAFTLAAQYWASNAKQRADIRQSARYFRVAGIVQNTDSRRAFRRYLADLGRDRAILDHASVALATKASSAFSSDFQQETALRNIENIQRFVESEKALGLGNYGFEAAPSDQPDLIMCDVPVSVSLDCFVTSADEDGESRTGGAMIQLTKGGALPEKAKKDDTKERRKAARLEVNRLASVLVLKHLEQNFSERGAPSRDKCLIIDPYIPGTTAVFGRVEAQVRQLEEAVQEIARQWDVIRPPADYDG